MIKKFLNKKKLLLLVSFFYLFTNLIASSSTTEKDNVINAINLLDYNINGNQTEYDKVNKLITDLKLESNELSDENNSTDKSTANTDAGQKLLKDRQTELKNELKKKLDEKFIIRNANRTNLINNIKETLRNKKENYDKILPQIEIEETFWEEDTSSKPYNKRENFKIKPIAPTNLNRFNQIVRLYFKDNSKLIKLINEFKGNNINDDNLKSIRNEIYDTTTSAKKEDKLLVEMFISVNIEGTDLAKNKTASTNAQSGRKKLKDAVKKAYKEQDKDFDKNVKISERKKNLKRIETLNKTIEKILTKLTPEIFLNFLEKEEAKNKYKELYKKFLITNIKNAVSDFSKAITFINSEIGKSDDSGDIIINQLKTIKNNLNHYNKIINNKSDITKDNIDDRTMRDFLLNNDVILANSSSKYIKASTYDSYYENITDTDITSTIHKDVYLKNDTDFEKIYLDVSKLKDDLVEFLRNLKITEDINSIYKDNNEKAIEDFKKLAEITLNKHFENEKEEIKEKAQRDISNISDSDNDKKNEEIKKLKENEEKDIKVSTEQYTKNSEDLSKKINAIMKENKVDVKENKDELAKALDLSTIKNKNNKDIDINIFKSFSTINDILTELKKPVNHYLIYTSKVKSMDVKSNTTTTTAATVAAAPAKAHVGGGAKHGGGKGAPAKGGRAPVKGKGTMRKPAAKKQVGKKQTRKQVKKASKKQAKKNNK